MRNAAKCEEYTINSPGRNLFCKIEARKWSSKKVSEIFIIDLEGLFIHFYPVLHLPFNFLFVSPSALLFLVQKST